MPVKKLPTIKKPKDAVPLPEPIQMPGRIVVLQSPQPSVPTVTPGSKVTNLPIPQPSDNPAPKPTTPRVASRNRWTSEPFYEEENVYGFRNPDSDSDSPPSQRKTAARRQHDLVERLTTAEKKQAQGKKLTNLDFALLSANKKLPWQQKPAQAVESDDGSVDQPNHHANESDDGSVEQPRHQPVSSGEIVFQDDTEEVRSEFGQPDSESDPAGESDDNRGAFAQREPNRHVEESNHDDRQWEDRISSQESGFAVYGDSSGEAFQSPQREPYQGNRQQHDAFHPGTANRSSGTKRQRSGSRDRHYRHREHADDERGGRHERSPARATFHSRQRQDSRDLPRRSDRRSRDRQHRGQRSDSRERQRRPDRNDSRDRQRSHERRENHSHDNREFSLARSVRQRVQRPDPEPTLQGQLLENPAYVKMQWFQSNPTRYADPPTWEEMAHGNMPYAKRLFATYLRGRGITPSELARKLNLKSHSLDTALETYTLNELDDTIAVLLAQRSQPNSPQSGPSSTNNRTFRQAGKEIPVLRVLDADSVERFCVRVTMDHNSGDYYTLDECITPANIEALKILLPAFGTSGSGTASEPRVSWDLKTLCEQLRQAFPRVGSASSAQGVVECLQRFRPEIGDLPNRDTATRIVTSVTAILTEGKHHGEFNQKLAVNALTAGLVAQKHPNGQPREVSHVAERLHKVIKAATPPISDVTMWLHAVTTELAQAEETVKKAAFYLPPGLIESIGSPSAPRPSVVAAALTAAPAPTPTRAPHPSNQCSGLCFGCGHSYLGAGKRCASCTEHPDRNMDDCPFTESKAYSDQLACDRIFKKTMLIAKFRANGNDFTPAEAEAIRAGKEARKNAHGSSASTAQNTQSHEGAPRNNSRQHNTHANPSGAGTLRRQAARTQPQNQSTNYNHYQPPANNPRGTACNALTVFVPDVDNITLPTITLHPPSNDKLIVDVLIDSGALQANYLNLATAKWLLRHGCNTLGNGEVVDMACNGSHANTYGVLNFDVTFFNENTCKTEVLPRLNYSILDTRFPIIIGLPTIRKYNLTIKFPSFFGPLPTATVETTPSNDRANLSVSSSPVLAGILAVTDNWRQSWEDAQPTPVTRHQLCLIGGTIKSKMELLGNCDPDLDHVVWPDNPFDANFFPPDDTKPTDKITIEGSLSTQRKIQKLCEDYSDIFSECVRSEAADVPPMEIKVNPATWQTSSNRGPPRLQSQEKQKEIAKQVNKYLELGVIRTCTAQEYSNVHMVPKPASKDWRFCLDFVRLNSSTIGNDSWPIPNITLLLQRIGSRKSKVFGVMDLTAGYHQTPISLASQIFTAFIMR